MLLKLFTLCITLVPIFIFSQKNPGFSKEVWDLHMAKTSSYEDLYRNGEKMLEISKTNEDIMKSYFHMGDAKSKLSEYTEARQLLEKANEYAKKTDLHSEMLMINYTRDHLLRKMGLEKESEEAWEIVLELAKKINQPQIYSLIYERDAKYYEEKSDFCKANVYRLKMTDLMEDFLDNNKVIDDHTRVVFGINYDYVINNYIHCKKLDSAIIVIEKVENLLKKVPIDKQFSIGFHYLNKGMLASEKKNKTDARKWFDKAIEAAKSRKNENLMRIISKEAILRDVYHDNTDKKREITNTFIQLNKKKQDEISRYADKELSKKKVQINQQKNRIFLWNFITLLLIITIVFLTIYHVRKKKKLEIQFQNIIKNIEEKDRKLSLNKEEILQSVLASSQPIVENENKEEESIPSQQVISSKKEQEIVEKLQLFESGEDFNANNFTLNHLATILETNSYYTSQIIKKYRNKNFNQYINSLRVNFIVDKLYHDTQYRKYKISTLSEMLGFSSQSKFASAFKKEFEISPSEFIAKLK